MCCDLGLWRVLDKGVDKRFGLIGRLCVYDVAQGRFGLDKMVDKRVEEEGGWRQWLMISAGRKRV